MAHLTMADMASRQMAEKKSKWIKKAVKPSHEGRFKAKAERADMSTAGMSKKSKLYDHPRSRRD